MKNVFLDDLRSPPSGYYLVKTAEECINLLQSKKVTTISLDHDLGFMQPNGLDVVKFMVRNRIYPKKIIIHSANPFGRLKMFSLLHRNKPSDVSVYIRPLPFPLHSI